MTGRLAGKKALILGVNHNNLGLALAERFVAEGAAVAIAGRNADNTQAIGKELGVSAFVCDLADTVSIDRMVDGAAEALGGIDIGINSTGWGLLTPFLETTAEEVALMSALQFNGPYRFFQDLVRVMKDGGSLIQISSITATIMMDNHAAYMGTKAGMEHVMRTIANEFGPQGIRANSLAPGGIADAPMSGGGLDSPAMRALYQREIPLGRPGVKKDVVDAAVWLVSDDAGFVTGQTIHVSGGQTLRRNPSIGEIYGAFGG